MGGARAPPLATLLTTSDYFRTGFKTLSFSQPVYPLFAADKGTNPETAGRTAIEKIYINKSTEDLQLNKLNKNGEMRVTGK